MFRAISRSTRPRWRSCTRIASLSTMNPIPATYMRGGTSKGVFLHRKHLPEDEDQWRDIFLGIMGSPDPEHGRQLNGMGGGVSSLSKMCIVGPATDAQKAEGIHAEFTFVQVGIQDGAIDYSGTCGNLTSVVGVFALDEGIYSPPSLSDSSSDSDKNVTTVRLFNTNTGKCVDTTFPTTTSQGKCEAILDLPQVSMAGVPGKASRIVLDFVSPGGSRTGKLLPTGNALDTAQIIDGQGQTVPMPVSLVDATNPTVFIIAGDLRSILNMPSTSRIDHNDRPTAHILETIRRQGARMMGLDHSAQAQPKIAILDDPSPADHEVDVVVHALSMEVLHRAVPMTVGLCLGAAAGIKGTLAWEIVDRSRRRRLEHKGADENMISIRHPSGIVDVGAEFESNGDVKSVKVVRTGRRLMKGVVWW